MRSRSSHPVFRLCMFENLSRPLNCISPPMRSQSSRAIRSSRPSIHRKTRSLNEVPCVSAPFSPALTFLSGKNRLLRPRVFAPLHFARSAITIAINFHTGTILQIELGFFARGHFRTVHFALTRKRTGCAAGRGLFGQRLGWRWRWQSRGSVFAWRRGSNGIAPVCIFLPRVRGDGDEQHDDYGGSQLAARAARRMVRALYGCRARTINVAHAFRARPFAGHRHHFIGDELPAGGSRLTALKRPEVQKDFSAATVRRDEAEATVIFPISDAALESH